MFRQYIAIVAKNTNEIDVNPSLDDICFGCHSIVANFPCEHLPFMYGNDNPELFPNRFLYFACVCGSSQQGKHSPILPSIHQILSCLKHVSSASEIGICMLSISRASLLGNEFHTIFAFKCFVALRMKISTKERYGFIPSETDYLNLTFMLLTQESSVVLGLGFG